GIVEVDLTTVLDQAGLNETLQSLPQRYRYVAYLRFNEDRTQSATAVSIDQSKMPVALILSPTLGELVDLPEPDQCLWTLFGRYPGLAQRIAGHGSDDPGRMEGVVGAALHQGLPAGP